MNYAILLSGGTGSRSGADIPKQYVRSKGLMMVTYALRTLILHEKIDRICVVADDDFVKTIIDDIRENGLSEDKLVGFALPGATRQESVMNGLMYLKNEHEISDNDTVLIHDGVRPYLKGDLLDRCFNALPEHDGVMPVLPMKDTVYLCDDGRSVSGLLKRDKIFAGQAPELFNMAKYLNANAGLNAEELSHITGASEPAIKAGMDICTIIGDEDNMKVTSPHDLEGFING